MTTDLSKHIVDTNNPHNVTKHQVGLGNVNNYATATYEEGLSPNITNKFIVPQVLQYALNRALEPADLSRDGVVRINNGVFDHDDIDHLKALSARGLVNLLTNTNGAFNVIQQSILSLTKQHIFSVKSVVGDANNIILNVFPHTTTDLLCGIIRFKAEFDNTEEVTIKTGNIRLPVTLWNGQGLEKGNILKGNVYGVLPLSDSLILLNPTTQNNNLSIEDLNKKITDIIDNGDLLSEYTKLENVKDIAGSSFKGSYLGKAFLNNDTYKCEIPNALLTLGIFAITFDKPNIKNPLLDINDIKKPLLYIDNSEIDTGDLIKDDTRIVINTKDYYLVHSAKSDIVNEIKKHTESTDPHSAYWNDERGLSKLKDYLDEHLVIVSEESNGLMRSIDKAKLDLINLEESITQIEANADWN